MPLGFLPWLNRRHPAATCSLAAHSLPRPLAPRQVWAARLAPHTSPAPLHSLRRLLHSLICGDSWGSLTLRPACATCIGDGLAALIGGTPLIRLASLSEQTGCEILAKAEFMNPGGSVKDRVALEIVRGALAAGRLAPGGLVCEGTVGSTGVSLAMVAAAHGCRAFIAMPDDAAIEKAQMLEVGSHEEEG